MIGFGAAIAWYRSNLTNTKTIIIMEDKMSNLFSRKLKPILVLAILMCCTILFTVTAQTITTNQLGTNDGYFY